MGDYLERTVASTFENITTKPAMRKSFELFERAEAFLEPYAGQYLPEQQIRALIHETGLRTFPRPKGIPENFLVKLSKNGGGMIYVHPENTHISIRVMPGKPHSCNPSQRKPYVIQMKEGKAFDKYGNMLNQKDPEVHIPLEEFVYRE